LLSAKVDLDRRSPGVAGAAAASPHGLIQEFLNESEEHLWGIVSNGETLRLLRDNLSLTRQAFVEFDLKAIFDGELYSDFALFWLLVHESRLSSEGEGDPQLERWSKEARLRGVRALDTLRDGVERAIETLGQGFLSHRSNRGLRDSLRSGQLSQQDYYRLLLRAVYRLIFLFAAEDRDLLLVPESEAVPGARETFSRYYSTIRVRGLAERRRGSRHPDLWSGLAIVFDALGREGGCPELALPGLGSFLWEESAGEDWVLENTAFLQVVRHLSLVEDEGRWRHVDFRNLGPEELGSVYESLLELEPDVEVDAGRFLLRTAQGSERKETGSYYTPESLIQALLDTALEPAIDEALRAGDPESALLSLRVLDPAVGSGHFLLGAANRIARRLAAVRGQEEEPSPREMRRALRDVISRCLFGVDINPMAAELCKVSLWLEALEPGRPLSFLDHHIQVGNSLLGATPELLKAGIPDEAFQPIAGDESTWVSSLRRQNRKERAGQTSLLGKLVAEAAAEYETAGDALAALDHRAELSLREVHEKEKTFRGFKESPEHRHAQLTADAWCSAFVWPKHEDAAPPITEGIYRALQEDPRSLSDSTTEGIQRLKEEYKFFHFHVAFPQIFQSIDSEEVNSGVRRSGFDAVLGNPPWDQIQLDARVFFANSAPSIAGETTTAKRNQAIAELEEEDPELFKTFAEETRRVDGIKHFVHTSGAYPLTSFGRLNTAPLFAELARRLQGRRGRVGLIVPTGIATDSFNQYFFKDLTDTGSLSSLFDFENRKKLFPIDSRIKFCLLTLRGLQAVDPSSGAEYAFYLTDPSDLDDPDRRFTLTAEDVRLLNPNTSTCPVFRTRADAEVTKAIYRRVPVLVREDDEEGNPWGFSGLLMFMMNTASHLFRTRSELESSGWQLSGAVFEMGGERYLPLYEGKMVHHFDYRWATYDGDSFRDLTDNERTNSAFTALPRFWVPELEVEGRLRGRWSEPWLVGWRDITNATNERTVIASIVPRAGAGNNLPIAIVDKPFSAPALAAILSSFAVDFAARFKVGGTHLNFYLMHQLPVISPDTLQVSTAWSGDETAEEWILKRAVPLFGLIGDGDNWRLSANAREYDETLRQELRDQLDAAMFHLYGLSRSEVEYVMSTFPIVKRKDEERFGVFRTKERILQLYDQYCTS
jgi:hypothetical protein